MAEQSGLFNSKNGDRRYYVSFLAEYFASFIGNGVYFGGNQLKVRATTSGQEMTVELTEGKGWINGYYYALKDGVKQMSIAPPHGSLSRKDNVVLQLDLRENGRTIQAKVITGVPSAAPVAPQIQRDNAIYELKLAEVFVSAGATRIGDENITDFRTNNSSCGIVSSVVPINLTYDNLFNQMSAELNARMKEWDATKQAQKTQWDNQMAQQARDFSTKQTAIQAWYNSVKTDISKLQVIDFDNITALSGVRKSTVFTSDTVITDTIRETVSSKKIAEKITTFLDNGNIQKVVTIYDTDGTAVLTRVTSTVVFQSDGSITEEVV